MVDYSLAELAYYEKIREFNRGQCQQGARTLCFFDYKLVPEKLKVAKNLECLPESRKDYHPDLENPVVDLVHPSLYPLQYGITPIVEDVENDHVSFYVD